MILAAGEAGLLFDFGIAGNLALVGAGLAAPIVAGRFHLRRVLKARREELKGLLNKLANVSREAIEDYTPE